MVSWCVFISDWSSVPSRDAECSLTRTGGPGWGGLFYPRGRGVTRVDGSQQSVTGELCIYNNALVRSGLASPALLILRSTWQLMTTLCYLALLCFCQLASVILSEKKFACWKAPLTLPVTWLLALPLIQIRCIYVICTIQYWFSLVAENSYHEIDSNAIALFHLLHLTGFKSVIFITYT